MPEPALDSLLDPENAEGLVDGLHEHICLRSGCFADCEFGLACPAPERMDCTELCLECVLLNAQDAAEEAADEEGEA